MRAMWKILVPIPAALVLFALERAIDADALRNWLPLLSNWIGPAPAEVIVDYGPRGVIVLGYVLLTAYLIGVEWGRRGSEARMQARALSAESLPQMTAYEIANHVHSRSAWGRWKLLQLNRSWIVKGFVSYEMERVARLGEVRFLGIPADHPERISINPGHWHIAEFDEAMLWDRNGRWSTRIRAGRRVRWGPVAFHHVTAPRADVLAAWPRASIFLRAWVRIALLGKDLARPAVAAVEQWRAPYHAQREKIRDIIEDARFSPPAPSPSTRSPADQWRAKMSSDRPSRAPADQPAE